MKHRQTLLLTIFMMAFLIMLPTTVKAACCSCAASAGLTSFKEWGLSGGNGTVQDITSYVNKEINRHEENFLINTFFKGNLKPALDSMTSELILVALKQTEAIGRFFDAKHQLETQRLFQSLEAKAHKDYHPSVGMCEIGSAVKSIAASERKGEINAVFLSQRSQDRQLGSPNTVALLGPASDKPARFTQYEDVFCDPNDNGPSGNIFCKKRNSGQENWNRDIDFTRTIDNPWTLDVDFTGTENADKKPDPEQAKKQAQAEEQILALASNLYAYDVFDRVDAKALGEPIQGGGLNDEQAKLMDIRAYAAKRSVAENSFNALVGMKSKGTAGSAEFLKALVKELGISEEEIKKQIGDNPSYYAQMEVLTKKIYQDPDFFMNLYDKPANVERKGVALQAIGLMQKFDMLDSYLRNEASLSILLEMAVTDLQQKVEDAN